MVARAHALRSCLPPPSTMLLAAHLRSFSLCQRRQITLASLFTSRPTVGDEYVNFFSVRFVLHLSSVETR